MHRPTGGRRTNVFGSSGRHPALIAHGAGNSRKALKQSLAAGADLIEVDLWVHRGAFEARHERRLGAIPLLFDSWALRVPPQRPLSLVELLDACRGRAGILMDLKNRSKEAVELVRSSLQRVGRPGGLLLASSQSWPLLRGLREACPSIRVLYSIDVPAQLALFASVSQDDRTPSGISCRHSLLNRQLVAQLHEHRIAVSAWTVDDPARAEELASWGVDALTTSALSELRRAVG